MTFIFIRHIYFEKFNFCCLLYLCIEIARIEALDNSDYNIYSEYENNPPVTEQPEDAVEDFLTYKNNMEDMRKYEQKQLEIVSAIISIKVSCLII